MISLSLENRNDDHKQDYCICTNFSRMQKQKVLKSVLGEDVSTELNKLCLFLISNCSNVMERKGHSSRKTVAACLFAENPHSRTWMKVKLFVSCVYACKDYCLIEVL